MNRLYPFTFAAFAVWASVVNAQQQPQIPTYDAGALIRQTEQNLRQSQLQQAAQKREPLPPAAVLTDSTTVTVERFKFSGNRLLSTDQLTAVAAPFANRTLNQHDLQHLTDAVSEAYRTTGWLVQAYIPRQSLSGPELTVQVIETIPPSKPSR
jgi:hemolysin activation/secretion protein